MDPFASRMLFFGIWLCSVGVVALFTLSQFGWFAAVTVAVPMTIIIGAIVTALLHASEAR